MDNNINMDINKLMNGLNNEIKTDCNKKELLFNIYKEYIIKLIISVESTVFLMCNQKNLQKNLNHDSIFNLIKPLLYDYFQKLKKNSFEHFDIKTIDKLYIIDKKIDNKKFVDTVEELINLNYPFLDRSILDINNNEEYFKQIMEQLNDLFIINKMEIINLI
tara:strand:- start:3238 stop:3723 length:486 start_codon:yes stop_codon:yes gene_type:complete